jgi:hypothetical protein
MSSKAILIGGQRDRRTRETPAWFDRLIDDAMILCGTTDPALEALLASVLERRQRPAAGNSPPLGQDPTEILLTVFHMFIYACAEARTLGRPLIDVRRLEMCIGCLADRLDLAPLVGSNSSAQ